MNKKEKLAVVKEFSKKYKGIILTKVSEVTGYSRKHLIEILPKTKRSKRIITHPRVSRYLQAMRPLRELWVISNYACGQRLVPMIPTYLERLAAFNELKITETERGLLLRISSATVDRLLIRDRKRINIKGKTRTKPGTLLKHQIPIKTWADWDNTKPGFLEIDSVHHCGTSLFGEYLFTLDTIDVATGWNECQAHMGKSEMCTVDALEMIRTRLPFKLLGIDFDNGGEFVNRHLLKYADRFKISYTRSRESIKNDKLTLNSRTIPS